MRTSLFRVAMAACCAAAVGAGEARADAYAEVQYLALGPKVSSRGFNNNFYAGAAANVDAAGSYDESLQFGLRLIVGAQDESGFGGRIRWFTYDNDLDYTGEWEGGGGPIQLSGVINLDVDYIDTEFTQACSCCGNTWSILGSGGVRWGRVAATNESVDFPGIPAAVNAGQAGLNFEGAGPTFAMEVRRPIAGCGVTLFATGRTSLLCGDFDIDSNFLNNRRRTIDNEIVQVWELQSGFLYLHQLDCGAILDAGVFGEAQRWDSETGAGDLGLFGVGIQTGIRY